MIPEVLAVAVTAKTPCLSLPNQAILSLGRLARGKGEATRIYKAILSLRVPSWRMSRMKSLSPLVGVALARCR